ncbi:hypothetical protein [Lonepinella koalarum]|uniref:Chalcone isomerase-like protein n=1 Tax=Lonepinella koalarum TaxID=53417 RepID=A0A4R1KR53_9PAST|nr:hypothetical protein [Lonepinella koalarum]MDH2926632.1 hypothetical protein [Lonepinella koalarum]TCK66953.1 hypothetical protein EV692_2225 [Lonepinella koalarum]TFJ88972.1 hypothetical protein E0709_11055 [Lonepinella koalarum]
MKIKLILCLLLGLLPSLVLAQWKSVGKADYNWGPFLVYSITLSTETGQYQENERPLMLTFTFDKQVEGKNFAVTLIKEIDNLKIANVDTSAWLKELQRIFPDFSPQDHLSFIALANKSYFVLNDTVLDYEFDSEFAHILTSVWLSEKTNFSKMREMLLNQNKIENEAPKMELETVPLNEEDVNPQLPPEYPLENQPEAVS